MTATLQVTRAEVQRAVNRFVALPDPFREARHIQAYGRGLSASLAWHERDDAAAADCRDARAERQDALSSGDAERLAVAAARVQACEYKLAEIRRASIAPPPRCDLDGEGREIDRLAAVHISGEPVCQRGWREENAARRARGWNSVELSDMAPPEALPIVEQRRALVASARRWAASLPGIRGVLANPADGVVQSLDRLEALARMITWGRSLEARARALDESIRNVPACRAVAGSPPIRLGDTRALEVAVA
jgi:hypothetical protein